MIKHLSALCILMLLAVTVRAQSILDVGIRFQHSVGLYNENGVSVSYSPENFKNDKLFFGFHYISSRLGTAWGSNAIKQDNVLMSAGWSLRKGKMIRPFGRINTGLFKADYGDQKFDELPQSSLILSTEIGVSAQPYRKLKLSTSIGYNWITGDGMSGPGTLYPVFYQLTASWNILKKNGTAVEKN